MSAWYWALWAVVTLANVALFVAATKRLGVGADLLAETHEIFDEVIS